MPRRDTGARRADEPRLSVTAIQQRCRRLGEAFGLAIGPDGGEFTFAAEVVGSRAVISIVGLGSERVDRNAGRPHNVVRICPLADDIFAWAGYREDWRTETGIQTFSFVNAGFTVHVGRAGEVVKPQLLRSEWVGPRDGGFTNLAGHPHWQWDALESVRARDTRSAPRFNAEPDTTAREFGAAPREGLEQDSLLSLTVERMHFASAALWWRTPTPPVAHGAETVEDINRWALGCLSYLRQELARCVFVRSKN